MPYSWEEKNTPMVYDWHKEVISPEKVENPVVTYQREVCLVCGRFKCAHFTMKAQRPSTAAIRATFAERA